MFSESIKWALYLTMVVTITSSLAAFIASQYHVKSKTPDLWEKFFPGRSIGFAHDLKFQRFAQWYATDNDDENARRLPWFWPLWRYYKTANTFGVLPFGLLLLDFAMLVYQTGMIGGWKFR